MAIEDLPADYFSGGSHLTEAGTSGLRAKLTEIITEANAALAQLDLATAAATPSTIMLRDTSGNTSLSRLKAFEISPQQALAGIQPADLYLAGAHPHVSDVPAKHTGNIIIRMGLNGNGGESAQIAGVWGHPDITSPSVTEGTWPVWEIGAVWSNDPENLFDEMPGFDGIEATPPMIQFNTFANPRTGKCPILNIESLSTVQIDGRQGLNLESRNHRKITKTVNLSPSGSDLEWFCKVSSNNGATVELFADEVLDSTIVSYQTFAQCDLEIICMSADRNTYENWRIPFVWIGGHPTFGGGGASDKFVAPSASNAEFTPVMWGSPAVPTTTVGRISYDVAGSGNGTLTINFTGLAGVNFTVVNAWLRVKVGSAV